jgi:glycine oxidase
MQALVDGAIRADRITMLPFSPVTQLLTHGHRVRGVQFTTGTDLFADEVVVCAGAWTSQLLRPFEDIKLAICPIRGQLLCVATPYDPNLAGGAVILGEENEYVVPLVNGRWVVGSTFEDVGFDDRVTAGGLHEILNGAFAFAPKLAKGTILSHWAALRPSTPDGVPLIGRPSGVDGLVIAAGHFRNGLLLTPVTADIVHSLIHGEQAPVDLMPYAVERAPASNESPLLDAVIP